MIRPTPNDGGANVKRQLLAGRTIAYNTSMKFAEFFPILA